MTLDLEDGLGRIASVAETAARPVAHERVLTRMRRRRSARAAATAAVGLGTVGGLAFAASAVTWDAPTPNAATSPSPSTPGALVATVTADGPFECGRPVPALVDPPGDAEVRFAPFLTSWLDAPGTDLEPRGPLDGASIVQGGDLIVDAVLVNGTAGDVSLTVRDQAAVEIWVAQDGVVVGSVPQAVTMDYRPFPYITLSGGPGTEWSQPVFGQVVRCGGFYGDDPLAPGDYDVYLTEGFFEGLVESAAPTYPPMVDPFATPVPADESVWGPDLTAVGGPYSLTIVPDPAAPTDPPPFGSLIVDIGGVHAADWQHVREGVGMHTPLPTDAGPTDMVRWDPEVCAGTDDPGRWVPVYPDVPDLGGVPSRPFAVHTAAGTVVGIDVLVPGIPSWQGIQIGMTTEEMLAKDQGLALAHSGVSGAAGPVDIWIQRHNDTTLAFEVAVEAEDQSHDPALVGRVVAISLAPTFPDTDPAFGADLCE